MPPLPGTFSSITLMEFLISPLKDLYPLHKLFLKSFSSASSELGCLDLIALELLASSGVIHLLNEFFILSFTYIFLQLVQMGPMFHGGSLPPFGIDEVVD